MAGEARLVEAAVNTVLDAGLRTGDIMQSGMRRVSTTGMGEAIVAAMDGAAQAAAGLDAVAT
jgi:3-isopropylmalate dehydrogenase